MGYKASILTVLESSAHSSNNVLVDSTLAREPVKGFERDRCPPRHGGTACDGKRFID